MSEALAKWAKHQRSDEPQEDNLKPGELRALHTLQREAEEHGATLQHEGKGGLSPSLALGVFRRDKYQCKRCGKNQDISLHHKGGVVESKWLSRKGHSNDPNNIVTICKDCHNAIHEKAKAEGTDSSQVTPEGDKGTDRDHH